MTFLERLSFLVTEKAKSKSDFASLIGLSQVTFNNYMLGKRKPSFELVESILRSIPEVSAEWLLRGNGEMLKSEQQPLAQVNLDYSTMGNNNVVAKGNSSVSGDVAALQNTIKELQKMISDQQKTINKLVEKL